ncbi:MAG: TIGR03032 family protein [Chloroflexi bacterium]|nr:TIGR03032 family protein [Chloroflexota bacterium]
MRKLTKFVLHNLNFRRPQYSDSILISFCNLTKTEAPGSGLLQLDLKRKTKRWIKITDGAGKVKSSLGIAAYNNELFHVFRSTNGFHLAVLDLEKLYLKKTYPLTDVEDVHSIIVSKVCIYVVSTGTDEVVAFPFQNGNLGKKEIIWTPTGNGRDTHHLNAICLNEHNELVCSGFGPKKTDRWSSADEGYIYNITTQAVVKDGIYHPHSVVVNNNLYYCESVRSSVHSLNDTNLFQFEGYTRGIGFLDENIIVVGSSKGRKISKSTGLINNMADPGVKVGKCEIHICELQTGREYDRIDLSDFGDEIYDILSPSYMRACPSYWSGVAK